MQGAARFAGKERFCDRDEERLRVGDKSVGMRSRGYRVADGDAVAGAGGELGMGVGAPGAVMRRASWGKLKLPLASSTTVTWQR